MQENKSSVSILLCTFNGARFLTEQLDSFTNQTHRDWKLFVSDDGSIDNTKDILLKYQQNIGSEKVTIFSGPQQGFRYNFMSLICNKNINSNYYSLSDQDDVWERDKLDRALSFLRSLPENTPALYCSRTCYVDENNKEIGFSPLFTKSPCFSNALVQSIAGGNTMVFNHAARCILIQIGANVDVISHDWWLYQVITGYGGMVFYDQFPSIRYRQHADNIIGKNIGWLARFRRLKMLFAGRFRDWNQLNINALERKEQNFSKQNQEIFANFRLSRKSKFPYRIFYAWRSGIFRQTFLGNISLWVAIILNKV